MKRFFETPTKALISILCIVVLLAVVGGGAVLAANIIARRSSIGSEQALNFACADAGIDPHSVETFFTEFDFERGQFVYEVDFYYDGTEYEYQIKASDGTVLKKELEVQAPKASHNNNNTDMDTNIGTEPSGPANTPDFSETYSNSIPSEAAGSDIGSEEAKSIAVSHAGFSPADVTFSKVELEREHGVMVYEIEFYQNGMEYEYEINAADGTILKHDSERD